MNEILRFYLETILPTAVQKNHLHPKTPIDSIGSIFQDLKRDMVKCVSPPFGPYEISLKDDLREKIWSHWYNYLHIQSKSVHPGDKHS